MDKNTTQQTEIQAQKITELRNVAIGLMNDEPTDDFLKRWLQARGWDVKKAEIMLKESLKWRSENRIDTILEDYKVPHVLQKYFPGGVCGEDKEGHPIYIHPLGTIDFKGICYSVKKSEIVRFKVYETEKYMRHLYPQLSLKHKRPIHSCLQILDLENFGKDHLWIPGAELYIAFIKELDANYPETLHKTYIINAPKLFSLGFRFVKSFLSEGTLQKFEFLGGDWKERLLQVIDKDQLPVHYGGAKMDQDGDEKCSREVCYGGIVPESYYLKKEEILPAGKSFRAAIIKNRSLLRLEYEVTEGSCVLRWIFTTEKYNLAYSVLYKKDNNTANTEEIVPTTRVNSHLAPEDGFITCEKTGTYVFQFDNTFSLIRKKRLSYFVETFTQDLKMPPTAINPSRDEEEIIGNVDPSQDEEMDSRDSVNGTYL